jgi:TolB-like protein
MKSAFLHLYIVLIVGLAFMASSCGTYPNIINNKQPGLLVKRVDAHKSVSLYIYIDGKQIEFANGDTSLVTGASHGCGLPNGTYRIHAGYYYEGLSVREKTEQLSFTINNNRIPFNIEVKKTGGMIKNKKGKEFPEYTVELVLGSVAVDTKRPNPGSDSPLGMLDEGIHNSYTTISENLSDGIKIAIVNITSDNEEDREYIIEELSVLLVNAKKYTIVDRKTLEAIKMEQNFQMSGEVDDDSVVSIGQFLGADVVITGSVSGEGDRRRLRLKALDVKTAQILAMSSARI